MMKKEDLCFHESTVLEFIMNSDWIKLKLEDVRTKEDEKKNVELMFKKVKKIEIDDNDIEINDNNPELQFTVTQQDDKIIAFDFGGVLTLDFDGNKVNLLIEWMNFDRHILIIKSYLIECEEIIISVTDYVEGAG